MGSKTIAPMILLMWGAVFAFASADAPSLEQHYQAALTALERRDADTAKRELKLSLQDNPLHSESHFLLASLLGREGDLDQAMVGFQRAMTLEPSHASARYNLGTALLWRGEPFSAARLLEEAIALRPNHVPSYNNLAKAYFLAGLPELAIASYREALGRDPSNAIALKGLAALGAPATPPPSSGAANAATAGAARQPPLDPDPASAPERKAPSPMAAQATAGSAADNQPGSDPEIEELREFLGELRYVTAERRGGGLTLGGWTSSPAERTLLDRILKSRSDVLDLTTDDVGDSHRLLEVDAPLFLVLGLDSQSVGHNFLRRVEVNASVYDGAMASFDWLYSAAISYDVNIANATEERVAFLARPHLTTLGGSPATFIAGGDVVFRVSGTTSGDIKPYPFGTSLEVTPTLLRTPGDDGSPRIRVVVRAGRKSILPLQTLEEELGDGSTAFENVEVTSEAILGLNQTLILTGLNQRERRTGRSGVPILKSIPIIKHLFSETISSTLVLAIIILLTPRDPDFWDEQNRRATADFVEKRRAYVRAAQGNEEDMRRFKERYPDWGQPAPNRFASRFFLMENSDAYHRVSGIDLASEDLDYDLLGTAERKRKRP